MPGAAAGSFILDYNTRAGVLKTAAAKLKNGTLVTDIFTAIMYDVENFDSNAAMGRLQAKVMDYGVPFVGGLVVKAVGPSIPKVGKYSGIAGDILMGLGAGKLVKAFLDPPVTTAYSPPSASVAYKPAGCCGGNGSTAASPQKINYSAPVAQVPAVQVSQQSRNPYL